MLLFVATVLAQPTIAVVPFHAHTEDPKLQRFGASMADMLTTDLGGHEGLQLVERAQLAPLLDELALSESGFVTPASAQQLGRGVSADALLVGALTFVEDRLRIDARVVDVESGQPVFTTDAEGPIDQLFGLERQVAHAIGGHFTIDIPLTDLPPIDVPPLTKKQARICRREVTAFVHPVDGKLNRSMVTTLARSWSIAFGEGDGKYGAGVGIILPGVHTEALEAGQQMRISGHGVDLVLTARGRVPPVATVMNGLAVSVYEVQYAADAPTLQRFATVPMERMVMWIGSQWHAIDVPTSSRPGIMTAARCILNPAP